MMSDCDHDELISAFITVHQNVAVDKAIYYLECSDWQLETATSIYLEINDSDEEESPVLSSVEPTVTAETEAKIIERDHDLLEAILRLPETKEWSESNHDPFKLVTLTTDSSRWTRINSFFRAKNYSHSPYEIQRVENPFLLGQYLLKKQKLERSTRDTREVSLFHCTKFENCSEICSQNFNWRKKGLSRGVKFGQGVSFSPDAWYASHFGEVMILAAVSIGKSMLGDSSIIVPPEPFTTTDNSKNTVYVKYEDDDFYPAYIIHYR